ncbi:fumarylacetoacetate hydrolase family protein [Deferribacter abyssi]|uniref:fumarylacetoacetate hydrolase family protein n=1 Tax=Deferribacter abyssi TaxID=213806 RepID=UPI003C21FBFC
MKLLRFKTGDVEKKGVYIDGKVRRVLGSFFDSFAVIDEVYEYDEIHFLPPVIPSKIVCIGRNYVDHAKELGNDVPEEPLIFLKPNSALNYHEGIIIYPDQSKRVDYEAELAVVIKKRCKDVSEEEALDYILGYTCFNDVTARDIQKKENKFTRGKSFDTFAPLGPFIETEFGNFDSLFVKSYVNGELRQNGNTKDMIFKVPYLISFISKVMTLYPGDVIATGTPEGVGELKPGDVVEVEVEGIGKLRNYVSKE